MSSSPPAARFRSRFRFNELALLVAIALVVLVTAAIDSNHAYWDRPGDSAREIARYTALLGIFALGSAVVIIAGGIDLSTGSTIAFSATVCGAIILVGSDWIDLNTPQTELGRLEADAKAKFKAACRQAENNKRLSAEEAADLPEVRSLHPDAQPDIQVLRADVFRRQSVVTFAAMAGAIGAGFFVGTFHAWLVTSVRLPPFIATLATLVGLRSFARVLCDGFTAPRNLVRAQINVNFPAFKYVNENVWVQVVVFASIALFTWFVLSRTILGRHIYALGGNEQAARLSGIRTSNVKWFAYCFSSITASIAGILIMGSELVAAPVNQGRGYELNAIAAAVVGGCSLQGGVGTVPGILLGSLFLRVVIDAVNKIIKSSADMYEGMIVGAVVVAAVTFSQLRQVWVSGQELFAGALGVFAILGLSLAVGGFAVVNGGMLTGSLIGGGTLVVLGLVKLAESLRNR